MIPNNEILQFIKENKLKTNKSDKIEFYEHRFLLDILRDNNKNIVVQKCVQAGVTFTVVLKILHLGNKENLSILYVLPSGKDARDFAVSKFDPVVEQSKLRDTVTKTELGKTNVWSSALKKIGGSYYFFRGAQSESGAQSIDGDIVVNDEYDFQPAASRKMFQERLEGSKSKGINYCIGYPISEANGIHDMFLASDRKEWFVTCKACGKRQVLTWPNNIDREKECYCCADCHAEISDEDRINGVWIPTNSNGNGASGYHISKMMLSWVTATALIKKFRTDPAKHFYNYTLGLPYSDSTSSINKKTFDSLKIRFTDYVRTYKKNSYKIIGIDQGNRFHYCEGVVSPKGCVITNIKIIDEESDLFKAIEEYNPDKVVMDMAPNRWTALRIQEKFGSDKVWLANIRTWQLSKLTKAKMKYYELKRSLGLVNIERNESVQHMIDALNDKDIVFLNDIVTLEDVYIHLRNMVPANEVRNGVVRKVFKKTGVGDDYGFAINMMYVASKLMIPNPEDFLAQLENKEQQKDIPKSLEKAIDRMLNGYCDPIIVIKPK